MTLLLAALLLRAPVCVHTAGTLNSTVCDGRTVGDGEWDRGGCTGAFTTGSLPPEWVEVCTDLE